MMSSSVDCFDIEAVAPGVTCFEREAFPYAETDCFELEALCSRHGRSPRTRADADLLRAHRGGEPAAVRRAAAAAGRGRPELRAVRGAGHAGRRRPATDHDR